MFDFSIFKKNIEVLTETIKELEEKILKKRNEIEFLKTSPPPKNDLSDYLCRCIDKGAETYEKSFSRMLPHFQSNPLIMNQDIGHTELLALRIINATEAGAANPDSIQTAIFALFGPQLKESIRSYIDKLPIEKNGPAVKERPALIAKAENELSKLTKEITDLKESIANLNISL